MAISPVVESLSPELDAIATTAAQRLRTQAQQAVIAAASSAISVGVALGEIAAAEHAGQARAREELGKDRCAQWSARLGDGAR